MEAWLVGVAASIAAILITVGVTKAKDALDKKKQYGHLLGLARKGTVQLVLPNFRAATFVIDGARAKIPANVRVIPLPEASAIADIVRALHSTGCTVVVVPPDNYQDTHSLTIFVGGPSVNEWSATYIERGFPFFNLKYPQHYATIRSVRLEPKIDKNGSLTEDFGFLAYTDTPNRNSALILLGVWAFGTRIATEVLLSHVHKRKDLLDALKAGTRFMVVAHGQVHGLELSNIAITSYHEP